MQNLDKTDLNGLETQIDSLLRNIHQLRLENSSLKNKITQLEHSLDNSSKKNQTASDEIYRIVSELKEQME